MSEALDQEAEILEAARERMAELGAIVAQRLVAGKQGKVELDFGKRILTLLTAYIDDLSDDHKESILYCLRQLSERFLRPSARLDITIPTVTQPGLRFGEGLDIGEHLGSGSDISEYW